MVRHELDILQPIPHRTLHAMAARPTSLRSEYQTYLIPKPSTVLDKISPDLRALVEPCLLDSDNTLHTEDRPFSEGK